jgi:beta-glucanase (GH16 family)
MARATTLRAGIRKRAAVLATLAIGIGALLTAPAPADARVRTDACGSLLSKSSGGWWACSFVDDFSGTSLDTTKWYVGNTAVTGFHMGQTCFTSDNVAVGGGMLRLTAKDTGSTFTCNSPYGAFTTRYTGAHLGTNGRFSQTYGRFEVRARYPQSGPGFKAGYWLYPVKQTYGAWPASGEIDVAERWSNSPNAVLPTLHYSGSTTADTGWKCGVVDPTVWHTYTLVWLSTQMQISIDGQTCFTDSWTPDAPLVAPQPFDQPFNIIMNMAVDNSGSNLVDGTSTFPAAYEVDYVKAWK